MRPRLRQMAYRTKGITPHPVLLPASSPWRACISTCPYPLADTDGEGTLRQPSSFENYARSVQRRSLSQGERDRVRGDFPQFDTPSGLMLSGPCRRTLLPAYAGLLATMKTALPLPGCHLWSISKPALTRELTSSPEVKTFTSGKSPETFPIGATSLNHFIQSLMHAVLDTNTPPGVSSRYTLAIATSLFSSRCRMLIPSTASKRRSGASKSSKLD